MSDEIKLTDHRDIGQQLDLFSFHEIAPGAPFWHPKGMIIFRELERVAREINDRDGYQEISTPIIVKREVFEKSGHWEHFRENMFYFDNPRDEAEHVVIKPMNCPESTYVFNSKVRSYRELPLRLAEIGRLHRNELSGTLGGLFRVRQITMDDAHIYLTPEQVEAEVSKILKTIIDFYGMFDFKTSFTLATRPEKALGDKEEWNKAENALKDALSASNVDFAFAEGEGAFYGPKIEVHLNDSQGRDWQMGTAQLDLVMLPKQFETHYTDEKGERKLPWVIHRAIFGSFERFIGVLLEHAEGKLPLWLSPVQVAVANINDEQLGYAGEIVEKLKAEGIRVEWYNQNETIGKKIREAELQKIPYIAVIGEKEVQADSVAIRERGKGDIGQIKLNEFVEKLKKEIKEKA
ncbi:MAG: threonine--tRNA ligase [Candidatus Yanofskybacteria bacterium]|nr:threonine--tRNA ligase [Candidatus Yanofskybacteria bacterium]